MSIDVSALKQFQKTFGPLLEAIPGVLDSLAAESDLDRAIAAKRKEFSELLEKIDEQRAVVAEQVANARALVKAEQDKLADVKKAIREERQAADVAAQQAKQEVVNAMSALESKRDALSADVRDLDAVHSRKLAALQAEYDNMAGLRIAEIAELTSRKDAAAAALDAIRAKLG